MPVKKNVVTAPMKVKLGKLPPKIDPRTLKLAKYIKTLAPPPTNAGYITKVTAWGMMLNDSLGDCTIAASGHIIVQETTYTGTPFIPPNELLLDAYEAVSGYSPDKPNSDNGAVILDVLNYWRKTGIAGHKIAAYVSVNPLDHTEVKQAVQLFGNCYIGLGLPITAQNPILGENGLPCWTNMGMSEAGGFGTWGGHCVPILGYGVDQDGNSGVEVITWGQVYDSSWGFLDSYCDEAYAVLSQDWIDAQGIAPSGFDLAALQADLAAL